MNRTLPFDWVRRHKAGMVALAIVAALVFTFWKSRGATDTQARFDAAVADRVSAETLLDSKQLGESDLRCRQAVAILTELARRSTDRRIRFEEAMAFDTLASIQRAADRVDEANMFYRDATGVWSELLAADQTAVEVRWRLARCLSRRAALLSVGSRFEEAEQSLERGSIVCRTRIGDAPSDRRVDRQLVVIKNQLGLLFLRTGRAERALATLESGVQASSELIGRASSTDEDRELLISALTNQARAHSAMSKRDHAMRLYGEARELAEGLSAADSSSTRYRDLVATLLETEAAELQRNPSDSLAARKLFERAFAIRESIVVDTPTEPECIERLAQTCGALAESCLLAQFYEKAEAYQRRELALQIRLTQSQPERLAYRFGRGRAAHNLAELLRQRGRGTEAFELESEAVLLLRDAYRENVLERDYRRAISDAYWTLCTLQLDRNDYQSAAASVDFYLSIEPHGFEEAHEATLFLCRCIVVCQEDRALGVAESERLSRSFADRATGALQSAVREGFRDLNELRNSHAYDSLRGRSDFHGIVDQVAEFNEGLKEG